MGDNDDSWLQCSSYEPPPDIAPLPPTRKRKKQQEKDESESKAKHLEITAPLPQVKLTTVPRSAPVPPKPKKKKKKIKRYFTNVVPEEPTTRGELMTTEAFMEKTKEFNIHLREHPDDVSSWLSYIDLQDRGEGTKRGVTLKKLSILEKALEQNPGKDPLLELKLNLYDKLHPFEKVVAEAKTIALRNPTSQVGWRWLLSSLQFNLSRLTVPGLINAFGDMLEATNRRCYQPDITLRTLLECGLFLRHAGLWELLFTLIENYLELCFSQAGSGLFKVSVDLNEEELQKLEDQILTSGLPLQALWIRTEHLRTCFRFLPSSDPDVEDHQRCVLPEDVSRLLYPMPASHSAPLAATVITLLKVPPIPSTDAFVRYLGLDDVPWHLESSEMLLTPYLSATVSNHSTEYLDEVTELAVSPQYVQTKFGEPQFVSAVDQVFHSLMTGDPNLLFIPIWRMRWWRFIISLRTKKGVNSKELRKMYKPKAKELLDQRHFFIPLFTEFALLENDLGSPESALKVLEKVISSNPPPLTLTTADRSYLFGAYRAAIELCIKVNDDDRLKRISAALAHSEPFHNVENVSESFVKTTLMRLANVSRELLEELVGDSQTPDVLELLCGSGPVHWFACTAWIWAFHEEVLHPIIQEAIDRVQDKWVVESLWQIKIDVLTWLPPSKRTNSDLIEVFSQAAAKFPNNTLFLHSLASLQMDQIKWSKISSTLISTGSPIAMVFVALISKNRYWTKGKAGPSNRLTALFTGLCQRTEYERCPLLRRIILQYVSATASEEAVAAEYQKAVEKCPWAKIVYYEAGRNQQNLLPEIQDLLVEKELRLHCTPEELEILRQDEDTYQTKKTADFDPS